MEYTNIRVLITGLVPGKQNWKHLLSIYPYDVEPGIMKITATLNYQLLVQPVAEYLNVPKEEYKIMQVNTHSTTIEIFD